MTVNIAIVLAKARRLLGQIASWPVLLFSDMCMT
jgi:hypothetical protein